MSGGPGASDIRRPAAGDRATGLVVLLHGVASSAAAMAWLADDLATSAPSTATFIPEGPQRSDLSSTGSQWFSVRGVDEANRAERVRSANAGLLPRIEAEQGRLGVGWSRTVVIGFSQGAIMAAAMAATVDPAPALVVALSGRLALPFAPAATPRGRVLLSHGTSDPVIPFVEMERSASILRTIGCDVEILAVPGHDHSITPRQTAATGNAIWQSLRLGDPQQAVRSERRTA